MEDEYVPPWRRDSVTLGSGKKAPEFNGHMPQVRPRADRRPKALDEAIERERSRPRGRPSGHSLIR